MNKVYKKTLEKQLELLSKRSELQTSAEEIGKYTNQMITIICLLDPELRSQSFVEAPNPYIGHLTMSDLEALALARREQERRHQENIKNFSAEFLKLNDRPRPSSQTAPKK